MQPETINATEFKSFTWDPRTLDLLGQYKDKIACIEELIMNSFHADANNVLVIVDKDKLIIQDDGHGFDNINNFYDIGGDFRKQTNTKGGRTIYQSKGIGRFAANRLGEKYILQTKNKSQELMWEIKGDFRKGFGASNQLVKPEFDEGTKWVIDLKSSIDVNELRERLQKGMPLRSDFKINLNSEEISKKNLKEYLKDYKEFKIDKKLEHIEIKGTLYLSKTALLPNLIGVWIRSGGRVIGDSILNMINMDRIKGSGGLRVRVCGELEVKGFESIFDITRRGFIQDSIQFKEFIDYIEIFLKKIAKENTRINKEKEDVRLFNRINKMFSKMIKGMLNAERETGSNKEGLISIKKSTLKAIVEKKKRIKRGGKSKSKKGGIKKGDCDWKMNHPLKIYGMKFGLNINDLGEHYPECTIKGDRIIINRTHPVLLLATKLKQEEIAYFKALSCGIAKLKAEKEGGEFIEHYEEALKECCKNISKINFHKEV